MSINDVISIFSKKFNDKEVFAIFKNGNELLVMLDNIDENNETEDNMYIINKNKQIRSFTPMEDIDKYEQFLAEKVYESK